MTCDSKTGRRTDAVAVCRGMTMAAGGGALAASDPNGAITLLEALPRQLGLKLERQKRTMPVLVIDHVEQKPTEN